LFQGNYLQECDVLHLGEVICRKLPLRYLMNYEISVRHQLVQYICIEKIKLVYVMAVVEVIANLLSMICSICWIEFWGQVMLFSVAMCFDKIELL